MVCELGEERGGQEDRGEDILGEERRVGGVEKSGIWWVGRGNPTLTFSPSSITVKSAASLSAG